MPSSKMDHFYTGKALVQGIERCSIEQSAVYPRESNHITIRYLSKKYGHEIKDSVRKEDVHDTLLEAANHAQRLLHRKLHQMTLQAQTMKTLVEESIACLSKETLE